MIAALNMAIQAIKQGVHKTETVATQIRDGHAEKTQRLTQLVEESSKSSSWSFWVFFFIFQALFLFVFIYWKKVQNERNKSHFY